MKFKTGRALAAVALTGTFIATMLPDVSSASSALSPSSFNTSYSVMFTKAIQALVTKGKGSIGVILPDEVTSTRYVEFDAPALTTAFTDAGLTTAQFNIKNAQGSNATEITDAEADISNGAKVLLVDPLTSATGATIEKAAKRAGVKVIDYDRLTLGGSRQYYVSFNNVKVGNLIGQGLLSCITAWKVKSPVVYIMKGAPTDNNATLFAKGYDDVLSKAGYNTTKSSSKTVLEGTGTWTPSVALTDFQGAYTAHKKINAVVTPNDENAAPIINYLQGKGLKPKTFPFTGQDATLTGFQNILSGYQCGTVYKPIWLEAQAAAALALYLRAGVTPPKSLINGTTSDGKVNVASVLLTPSWVTAQKVESTVVHDGVISPVALCTSQKPTVHGFSAPTYAKDCKTYGIK